jgi:hypothetical protein
MDSAQKDSTQKDSDQKALRETRFQVFESFHRAVMPTRQNRTDQNRIGPSCRTGPFCSHL